VGREPDQAGRVVSALWLDLQISAPSAADVEATLTNPAGQARVLDTLAGVHINHLFGAQADADLRDAMDGANAAGVWQLSVRHRGVGAPLRVQRAVLMMDTEPAPAQSTFQSFAFDAASISNNGAQIQTLRLRLNDAANVDDVRFLINYAPHDENTAGPAGYLQVTPTLCREFGHHPRQRQDRRPHHRLRAQTPSPAAPSSTSRASRPTRSSRSRTTTPSP
jgi:hypothetical protein